jgi:hypothetical protein
MVQPQHMTTMALKPKLSNYDMDCLMDDAKEIMFPTKKPFAMPKAKKAA